MDYDGLYKDLMDMRNRAQAIAWGYYLNGGRCFNWLAFAKHCDDFINELFLRGYGGR